MIKIYLKNNRSDILTQDSTFYWSLLDFTGENNFKTLCQWDDANYILEMENETLKNLIEEIDEALNKSDEYLNGFVNFSETTILKDDLEVRIKFNMEYFLKFMSDLKNLASLAIKNKDKLVFNPY
jgi:hypothetical protein